MHLLIAVRASSIEQAKISILIDMGKPFSLFLGLPAPPIADHSLPIARGFMEHNGLQLPEGGDFEALHCQPSRNFDILPSGTRGEILTTLFLCPARQKAQA